MSAPLREQPHKTFRFRSRDADAGRCGEISAEGKTAVPMTMTFWPSSLASRDAALAATAALPLPVGLHNQVSRDLLDKTFMYMWTKHCEAMEASR